MSDVIVALLLSLNMIATIIISIRNVILHYRDVFPPLFCDHIVIYNECKLTLDRINIAEVQGRSSTWPWTRIMGIFVHGSFLNLLNSEIYSCILYAIVITVTSVVVYRVLRTDKKILSYATILVFLSSWYYVYLACAFNNGSLVCILIILALAVIEDRPITAGVIMAFAMVKAQIAFPFFVCFLIRKKWKTIITSVSIVCSMWAIYSVWIWSSPMEQLQHLLFGKVAIGSKPFLRFGMFDFILLFDNSKSLLALLLSIIVGLILLVVIETKFIPLRIKSDYVYLSYVAPAICCLLWFYTTKCDYLILTIVALGMMEWWIKTDRDFIKTVFLLAMFGCTLVNFTNILAQLLFKFGVISAEMMQPLEGRFDTLLLLGVLVVLVGLFNKNSNCVPKEGN